MKVTIKAVKQYGSWVYYPVDPNAAAFAAIAGTTTLTENTLKYVKLLGYEIEVRVEEPAPIV